MPPIQLTFLTTRVSQSSIPALGPTLFSQTDWMQLAPPQKRIRFIKRALAIPHSHLSQSIMLSIGTSAVNQVGLPPSVPVRYQPLKIPQQTRLTTYSWTGTAPRRALEN